MKKLLKLLGLYSPTLKELKGHKFPYEPIQNKNNGLGLYRHIEKIL